MYGLLVKSPWIEMILERRKTWEIRGSRTSRRGQIALIKAGSGLVVGYCNLNNVVGPLSNEDMRRTAGEHRIPLSSLSNGTPYPKTYAWELSDAYPLINPIQYQHPFGAVIWVNLGDNIDLGSPGHDVKHEQFVKSSDEKHGFARTKTEVRNTSHEARAVVRAGNSWPFSVDRVERKNGALSMELHSEEGPVIESPSDEEIEATLRGLESSSNSFAILERSDGHFMQTKLSDTGVFVLEHHADGLDQNNACEVTDRIQVIQAFVEFSAGKEDWKRRHDWQSIVDH